MVASALWLATVANAGPHYLSCIDGHIVTSYADCPPIQHHSSPVSAPSGGGGGGLLGGLLGGLGGLL